MIEMGNEHVRPFRPQSQLADHFLRALEGVKHVGEFCVTA